MTTLTREQVVLWACESGDWNRQTCEMNDAGLVVFANLARADLEATIVEQDVEIERLRETLHFKPIDTAPKDGETAILGYQRLDNGMHITAPMYYKDEKWLLLAFHVNNTEHEMQPTLWVDIPEPTIQHSVKDDWEDGHNSGLDYSAKRISGLRQQLTAEQAKVKLLTEALWDVKTYLDGQQQDWIMKALATVKEGK